MLVAPTVSAFASINLAAGDGLAHPNIFNQLAYAHSVAGRLDDSLARLRVGIER